MTSRRTLKAASAIREVVSLAILTEIRDPRVRNVTVTYVEISSDMRYAKVHVSIMGDEKEQSLCLRGLQRSAGFLQKRVNDRIETRYTPRLQFVIDKGIKNSFQVAKILAEVLPPDSDAFDQDAEQDNDAKQAGDATGAEPTIDSSDQASPSNQSGQSMADDSNHVQERRDI